MRRRWPVVTAAVTAVLLLAGRATALTPAPNRGPRTSIPLSAGTAAVAGSVGGFALVAGFGVLLVVAVLLIRRPRPAPSVRPARTVAPAG